MIKVLSATCFALMLNLAADAWGQNPTPAAPAKAQTPSAAQASTGKPATDGMKMDQVSVSGCLTAGTTAGQYKLTDTTQLSAMKDKAMADAKSDASQKAEGAKKTVKDPGMVADSRMSFELVGSESELKPHVGHKVEVTGTVSKEDMAMIERGQHDQMKADKTAPAAPKTGQSAQPDKKMAESAMKPVKLNVTSIKHISPTCP
jgi:hypothetical protein